MYGRPPATSSPSQTELQELLALFQSKDFNKAEILALSLTRMYENHPFAWKILGAILQQTDRVEKSLIAKQKAVSLSKKDFEAHNNLGIAYHELRQLQKAKKSYLQALALNPNHSGARYNLGNALRDLGEFEAAKKSYELAIKSNPKFAEAYNCLGIVLMTLGEAGQAEKCFKSSIKLNSRYADAYNNLANLQRERREFSKAEVNYAKALALNPHYFEAHQNLGKLLQTLGRHHDSVMSFINASKIRPDSDDTLYRLGFSFEELGKLVNAEKCYLKATELNPEHELATNNLLTCLYLQDKEAEFFEKLDELIALGKSNAVIGSLVCRSLLKYGKKRSNLFCNEPLKFVSHVNLSNIIDFQSRFIDSVECILSNQKLKNRGQSLLENGFQTYGNLLDLDCSLTSDIENVIRDQLDNYRLKFKDSEEGLIKEWPIEYELSCWLVVMNSGGKIKPHIHDQGWLSGSIYINVPPKVQHDSGNLVLSIGEDRDTPDNFSKTREIIDVNTGSMVLFPASLTHYTIPFESQDQRIVLAFDVNKVR